MTFLKEDLLVVVLVEQASTRVRKYLQRYSTSYDASAIGLVDHDLGYIPGTISTVRVPSTLGT